MLFLSPNATTGDEDQKMAQLPTFAPFMVRSDVHNSEQSAGSRWKKWLDKFENLICALDITSDKRKKALLLHYIGEETYDIYDSFSDEKKGIGATVTVSEREVPNEYNVLKNSLTDYFTPKQNTAYEVFKFRQATQNAGETIDSYYTRLRTLASTCDFHDVDREILSQVIQGCTSSRVRRRALRDNYTLDKCLDEARALELSESRASVMEGANQSTVNATFKGKSHTDSNAARSTERGRFHSQRRGRGRSRGGSAYGRGRGRPSHEFEKCWNCGGKRSHTTCPAIGKECRHCKKMNHFENVCRSKTMKQVNFTETERPSENAYNSSSEDSVFSI